VEKACGEAILGKGSITISVKFPELEPASAKSPLLLFNGGEKVSMLTAKCTDGKLQSTAEAIFEDGTKAKTEVSNNCTPEK
jgi:hypothetical protein